MKRKAALIMALMMAGTVAFADVDLKGMTVEELEALQEQISSELMERNGVHPVTVPIGVWKVGKDIPLGHWTITAAENALYGWSSVVYCETLDETGKKPNVIDGGFYYHGQIKVPGSDAYVASEALDIDMQNEGYIIVEYGDVVFTPYEGAPDLGF
jgi:hypothetical protein